MKKTIITLSAVALSALSANAQGLVAGWDFADITNFASDQVNGYQAEKVPGINNGFVPTGQIYVDGSFGSSSLDFITDTQFFAAGRQAGAPGFADGFDQAGTQLAAEPATGQQSLAVYGHGGSFDVVFGVSLTQDAVFNYDFQTQLTAQTTDILDVSYSADGFNYTSYVGVGNTNSSYWQGGANTAWDTSTGDRGSLMPLLGDDQTTGTVDLTGLGDVAFVRLEFSGLTANEAVYLDNIHVEGTVVGAAVPEPSAFAAIAGALVLGFVGVRRRR